MNQPNAQHSIGPLIGEAVLQQQALALDVADVTEALPHCAKVYGFLLFIARVPQNANSWNFDGLLRARRERPRHCRNSLNEIASSHSSTSGSGLRRLAMRLHQDFATGGMVLAVNFAGRQSQPADVRFGSLADIARWLGYVCFASNSGHQSGRDRCRQPPTSCHSAATDAQCHTRNANLGGRLVTGWAFAG